MAVAALSDLCTAKIDIEGALCRFGGNEALYIKFLKKFLEDETFPQIKPAIEKNDAENAMNLTHTLKGVAANLGMTELAVLASDLMISLRSETYAEVLAKYDCLQLTYNRVCSALKNL